MIFSSEQRQYLEQLEFSPEVINNRLTQLNKEELLRALKLQKNNLFLTCHPDKTNGNTKLIKKFLIVNKAYQQLTSSLNLKPDILTLITPINYKIPFDCIDFKMEETIDAHFETLLSQYLGLNSDEERQEFVTKNETFLQFVHWLNENRSKIHATRIEALYQTHNSPSLLRKIHHEWNTLVIQLFAEENLDDITYREAISLGLFQHILATRKLLSPIKWLYLILGGLYNLITTTASHFYLLFLNSIVEDISNISSSLYALIPLVIKIIAMSTLLSIPSLLLPGAVWMVLLTLPLFSRILFYLANPINHIIRPIAEYFNISQMQASLAALALTAAGATALTTLTVSASLITTLIILTNIISILALIALTVLIKKLYDVVPGMAIALGLMVGISVISQLLSPGDILIPIETLSEILLLLTVNVTNLGLYVLGCIALAKAEETAEELYTTLPLPEEAASDNVKEAMKESPSKNNWAHTLFNTKLTETQPIQKADKSRHSMGLFGSHKPALMLTEAPDGDAVALSL